MNRSGFPTFIVVLSYAASLAVANVSTGTTYTNEASFLAASGSLSFESFANTQSFFNQSSINFASGVTVSDLPGIFNNTVVTSPTLDNVDDSAFGGEAFATDGNFYVRYTTTVVLGASNSIEFNFDSPVNAFGIDISSLANPGSSLMRAFDANSNVIDQISDFTTNLNPATGGLPAFLFRGFTSDVPFKNVIFTNSVGGDVIGFDRLQFMSFGVDQENPIFPDNSTPNPDGSWSFDAVPGDGQWFDPIAASGYVYATDGLSNFTAVELPSGLGDADGSYTISDGINPSVVVAEGAPYMFPTPVDQFTITGIDPTVDGEDPLAFPTFLAFDQTTVSFTMTPIPEPSSFLLAAAGLMALVACERRRVGRVAKVSGNENVFGFRYRLTCGA